MKILSTVSLFIFGVVLTSLLTAGLVFYQNNKTNQIANTQMSGFLQDKINKLTNSRKNIVLNTAEISQHNKETDCWMLISGKVYDVTSYFGLHPGGNSPMAATCGTDATNAYMTKDPYAQASSTGTNHSSYAKNLLAEYYIGDFNQNLSNNISNSLSNTQLQQNGSSTNPISNSISALPLNGSLTLNMTEISKHNKATDCWMLISGKVYNITSFFGSHPGGNNTMAPTCGTDATIAYKTKDPYAQSSTGSTAHSSNAVNMLASYFIGNLNQTIGSQIITQTNAVVAPTLGSGDGYEKYDD